MLSKSCLQIYLVLMVINYRVLLFCVLLTIKKSSPLRYNSERGTHMRLTYFLEVQLATDTEHAVGAGEGIADQRLCRGDTLVVVVVGLEVSCFQRYDIRHLVVEAQAKAVAVDNKRHIVHVLISELITGELTTS